MSISVLYCPHCGAANDDSEQDCHACQSKLSAPVTQSLLHERYRLLEQLGSGGFGAVYRAEDIQHPERPVAIKDIHLDGLNTRQVIEATETFERERRILAVLDHPRLPHLYETFEDSRHWYLVIDYFPGENLETRLSKTEDRRRLTSNSPDKALVEEVLRFGLALCNILQYLHSREPALIFRDLKPGNIICCPDGSYALIDFGIARTFKAGLNKDTVPLGSPGYAAPEQYGRAQTDGRADIFSLGAILHQMLSGKDPAEQPLHFDHLNYTYAPLRHLEKLITRMVALNMDERPATISEVARELQTIKQATQAGEQRIWIPGPGQTPPDHTAGSTYGQQQQIFQLPQVQPPTSRQKITRRLFIGAGVGLSAAIVGGGLLGVGSMKSRFQGAHVWSMPARSQSAPFDVSTLNLRVTGNLKQFTLSPDGQLLALVTTFPSANQDQGFFDTLHIWDNQGQSLLYVALSQLEGANDMTAAGPQSLAWSPDGQYLGLWTNSGLYRWQREGNTLGSMTLLSMPSQPLYRNGEDFAGSQAFTQAFLWSPDSRTIAYSTGLTINLFDTETSNYIGAYHEHEPEAYYNSKDTPDSFLMAWSPDGKYIASTNGALSGQHDNPIRIWRVSDQSTVASLPLPYDGVSWLQWAQGQSYLAYGNAGHFCAYNVDTQSTLMDTKTGSQLSGVSGIPLVAWSPDGYYLAFASQGGIQVQNMLTGGITMAQYSVGDLAAISWSPDGQYLLVSYTNSAGVQLYNTKDWSGDFGLGDAGLIIQQFCWYSNSRSIICIGNTGDSTIIQAYKLGLG